MATIGIKKSAWDAATADQKRVARVAARTRDLGSPALYQQANGVQWYIFDDEEFDLRDCAYLSTLCAGLASVPADVLASATREQVRAWIAAHVVWPVSVPNRADPWTTVLQANSAPNWFNMKDSVPAGLTPVTDE